MARITIDASRFVPTRLDENILLSFLLDPSRTAKGIDIYCNLLRSTTIYELASRSSQSCVLVVNLQNAN